MQILFRNAAVVDIENDCINLSDILVEDKKIKGFGKFDDFEGEVFDLQGDYVIPAFVNAYCDSVLAFENSYGIKIEDEKTEVLARQLVLQKNLFAGAVIVNDVSAKNLGNVLLKNVDEMTENELSGMSEQAAKSKGQLFMKVGQNLDELGAIDKTFKKTEAEVLEDFGFLDRKSVLVGGNCLEKDELQLLEQYGTKVVLTPYEDARVGRRPTNLVALKNLDFEIGLGVGEVAETDFFALMRQVILTQRGLFESQSILEEKDVFKIAVNGEILGVDNQLKVGNFAKFAVVKRGKTLYESPISDLIWNKSKKDVVMTVCNGDILQKNGKIFMKNAIEYDKIIDVIQQRLRRN